MSRVTRRSPNTIEHVAIMDGLRGIAILAVVWYHFYGLSQLAPVLDIGTMRLDFTFIPESGYLGVELFFFLSGFVLYYPYARSILSGAPAPTTAAYTYRRAIKILPSYYLSLILIVGLGPWLFFPSSDQLHQFLTHVAFVYNFDSNGIVAINAVYWSLAIEVQFYVIFPLICLVFARRPWVTAAVMTAIAIGYRFWSTSCCETAHAFARTQVPGFLDLYAAGMLCAYVYVKARSESPVWSRRPDWATVVALVFATLIIVLLRNIFVPFHPTVGPPANHPEYSSYLAVLLFGFSLSSLFATQVWQRLLANRVLLFFALISYNLYLYHLVLASSLVARLRFPPFLGAHPAADLGWQISFNLVALAIAVGVASLATFLVERPLLRMRPGELWGRLTRSSRL